MCEIQWIDRDGNPTPDSNPPIGRVRCKMYNYERMATTMRKPWVEGDWSKWFSICEEHAKQLSRLDMVDWHFEPLKNYELTFVHQNDDWTWTYIQAVDYHDAMAQALDEATKRNLRVHSLVYMSAEQVAANKAIVRRVKGATPFSGVCA